MPRKLSRAKLQTLKGKKSHTSRQGSKSKRAPVKEENDSSLTRGLLVDIAKKYKNIEKHSALATSPAHRSSMISEIQTLANALIRTEKRMQQWRREHRDREKRLKIIVTEQEEFIGILEHKKAKLELKVMKTQRNGEQLHHTLEQERVQNQQQVETLQN